MAFYVKVVLHWYCQLMHLRCAGIVQVLCGHCVGIVWILCGYCVGIVRVLCRYCTSFTSTYVHLVTVNASDCSTSLRTIVSDQIANYLVLPNKITVPLIANIDIEDSKLNLPSVLTLVHRDHSILLTITPIATSNLLIRYHILRVVNTCLVTRSLCIV